MTVSRDPPAGDTQEARKIRSMLLDTLHAMQSLDKAASSGDAPLHRNPCLTGCSGSPHRPCAWVPGLRIPPCGWPGR